MGNIVDRIGDFIVNQASALNNRRRRGSTDSNDSSSGYLYTYPTKNGTSFFSSHFIMGGERFETYQPESFLFGENLDLNFLGSKPTPFPYAAPCANEPTRSITSLLNIRKESIRLIRVTDPDLVPKPDKSIDDIQDHTITISKDKEKESNNSATGTPGAVLPAIEKESYHYNIEFVFDSDVMCSIRIYYFCHEEITCDGMTYIPRDWSICSDKVVFARGAGQSFSQTRHIFTPSNHTDSDLMYSAFDESGFFDPRVPFPIVIQMTALEGGQSHALIAIIERNNNGSYSLKPFVQKLFIDGLSYLMQEIYGIENKTMTCSMSTSTNKFMSPEEEEDECNSASECVVCLSDPRDTLILPCRHLCLCNACADSLRYQANNCPICRAPFRALLQIRAVRARNSNGHSRITSPQSLDASMGGPGNSSPVPPGYESVPLIEALNGPYAVARDRHNLAPDIERTPVSVRKNGHHRRHHKHHTTTQGHHAGVQEVQQQQMHHRLQPMVGQHQQALKMVQNAAAPQESIPLPTRRIIPITTAVPMPMDDKSQQQQQSHEPPEPAPTDWKIASSRIRRKQSDEETSSSASSGIIAHETTRLLNEATDNVDFLQRSASTKDHYPLHHRDAGTSVNYSDMQYDAGDLMRRNDSETADSSLSSLPSPHDSLTNATVARRRVISDDDVYDEDGFDEMERESNRRINDDEDDDDHMSHDFNRIFREVKVTDSNTTQFDISNLHLAAKAAKADSDESDPDKASLAEQAVV